VRKHEMAVIFRLCPLFSTLYFHLDTASCAAQ